MEKRNPKRVGVKPNKNVERIWKIYTEQLEETGVKLPEMEKLRPFMGKRGRVLKKKTRTRAQQEAYKKAESGVKTAHGNRTGAKAIKQSMAEQEAKNKARIAKAAQSFATGEKQSKKKKSQTENVPELIQPAVEKESEKTTPAARSEEAREERKQEEAEKPKSLAESAKNTLEEAKKKAEALRAAAAAAERELEEAQKAYDYAKMVEQFERGTSKILSDKVIYEIWRAMYAQDVKADDIEAFINKIRDTVNDIPKEARALYKEDEFGQILLNMREFTGAQKEDFTAMVSAVVMSDKDDHEDVMEAIRYWQEPENNPSGMSFSQFWDELSQYDDLGSTDNYSEILDREV